MRASRFGWFFRISWVAVTVLAPISAASGQQLGQASDADISLWRVFAAFALCVLLAVVAAFFVRARANGGSLWERPPPGRLRILETQRLAPQVWISLIVLDGQQYLISTSNNGATLIDKPSLKPDLEALCAD